MTQEQIAQRIEIFSRRLAKILASTFRARNPQKQMLISLEKQMLVSDIKKLAEMLRFTE